MPDGLRLSPTTARVLDSLLATPRQWRYGYDISRETDVKSGTLYPILMRLETHGMLESTWQETQPGRPPRHVYRLTPAGARSAREYLRACAAHALLRVQLRAAEG